MTFDPSAELLAMARRWRMTVAEMEAMTEALRGQADELTLRQALGATERETPRDIAHRYPQGFQALLEGRGPLPGFGDQPLAHFTRDRVATWLPKYQQLVAAGKRARRRVHGPAAEGPREGASAARSKSFERGSCAGSRPGRGRRAAHRHHARPQGPQAPGPAAGAARSTRRRRAPTSSRCCCTATTRSWMPCCGPCSPTGEPARSSCSGSIRRTSMSLAGPRSWTASTARSGRCRCPNRCCGWPTAVLDPRPYRPGGTWLRTRRGADLEGGRFDDWSERSARERGVGAGLRHRRALPAAQRGPAAGR